MADCLWIAGLLWDLLISIIASLIHFLMDCLHEVYCDSGHSNPLPNGFFI